MELIEKHTCFGGELAVYTHKSQMLSCEMKFSVFLPPKAKTEKVPFITFLSGLTCTHENFTTKAGAYHAASKLGIAVIAPDTSPRGNDVPDDPESYDFGKGAGFYLNATQAPWAQHYQMEHYIADELNRLLCDHFALDREKQGIFGHSMGGHGALTLYLKYPELYKSASAFSPIVAPCQVPWGKKALRGYLGDDKQLWEMNDACMLMEATKNRESYSAILIDQGTDDQFLEEQLKPHLFEEACQKVAQKLTLRMQEGYDHSYYFIQSFIADHISHHAQILGK